MSDLSQDLLVNEDGFELYYARFENNLKSMGDIINFFKKLSKCEQGYAKDLSSITKVDDPKLWRKTEHEIGTFLDCWSTLHTELQKLAQKHEELGQSINNQVTAMEKFYKEKQNTKKQLQKEGNKLTKEMHDSIANLKRAKETYYKDHKTADTTEALYNQRKTEGTKKQKDLDKLHKNSAEAKEKATSADQNYQKTLETANAIQSKFYSSEMPELLREFQKNEEERTNFFKHSMKGFMDSMSQFPPLLSSVTDNLNKAVDKIDTKADVSVFIQEHKGSAVAVPGQIEYEPFGGGDSGSLKLGGSLAGGATIRKTPQSTTPNQPVATVTSTAANANRTFTGVKPSGPLPSFGLTAADEALSVEEKKKKLEGQLTQVKDIIKTEVKSKKGLDKLAVFYQGDPTAQEKAQKEADEQQSRVDKLKAEKKKRYLVSYQI